MNTKKLYQHHKWKDLIIEGVLSGTRIEGVVISINSNYFLGKYSDDWYLPNFTQVKEEDLKEVQIFRNKAHRGAVKTYEIF